MGINIWDDDYSYLNDKDGQDYDEYIERLEREEEENDDWLRTRYAEPGDPDYDEFDSLTSVEEYIADHRDELTYAEIRDLKEEYGIIDDDGDTSDYFNLRLSRFRKPNSAHDKTTQSNSQEPQSNNTAPSAAPKTSPAIIAILWILGIIIFFWAIIDFMSLLSTILLIVILCFCVWALKPIFK